MQVYLSFDKILEKTKFQLEGNWGLRGGRPSSGRGCCPPLPPHSILRSWFPSNLPSIWHFYTFMVSQLIAHSIFQT